MHDMFSRARPHVPPDEIQALTLYGPKASWPVTAMATVVLLHTAKQF